MYDEETGLYSELNDLPAASLAGQSCQNALREISYTVQLEPKPKDNISKVPYYSIVSISADVVVQKAVTASQGDKGLIAQTYNVNFLTQTDEKLLQAKSGNPGYLDGYPLLAGFYSTENDGAISTFDKGFKIMGADSNG